MPVSTRGARAGQAPVGPMPGGDAPRFGDWLRQVRRARDLTRADLSARLGYSVEAVHSVEGRGHRPSREFAQVLARWLALPSTQHDAFVAWARGAALPADVQNLLPVLADRARPQVPSRGPAELPAPTTRLIGRRPEIAAALARLTSPDVRLLTLVGPPGVGKTRLAVAVAAAAYHTDAFPDGISFVPLATLQDPDRLAPTIARVLGLRAAAERSPIERLAFALRGKQRLLVLDNFEQVLAAGHVVGDLLASVPGLKVLVTSRERLHIYGEQEYLVPPLPLPGLHPLPTLATVAANPAVTLFVARACAARPGFSLSVQNAPTVAALCTQLDGLPLAIELAAASCRRLEPRELLARLMDTSEGMALLAAGPRDAPSRHRTVRGAIAWSYALLSPTEQTVFRRLGVFAGGFTQEAAEDVCVNGDLDAAALRLELESLLDKSLLQQDAVGDGTRYVMLETIRDYSQDQLAASGERETVQRRHAAYFLALAERAGPELRGARQVQWLDQLEGEHDNLRAALRWLLDDSESQLALRLAAALWEFWWMGEFIGEARRWLDEVLPRSTTPTRARATALNGAGIISMLTGEPARAAAYFHEAVAISRSLGDGALLSLSLVNQGAASWAPGEYASARSAIEEALTSARVAGGRWEIAHALHYLARLARTRGETTPAAAFAEEGLALCEALGNPRGIAMALLVLGDIARDQRQGERAAALYRRAMERALEARDALAATWALLGAGYAAGLQGAGPEAVTLLGGAEAFALAHGATEPRHMPHFGAEFSHELSALEAKLDPRLFASAWAQGHELTPEQAIGRVLGRSGSRIAS